MVSFVGGEIASFLGGCEMVSFLGGCETVSFTGGGEMASWGGVMVPGRDTGSLIV
jgi:hypothetical protein